MQEALDWMARGAELEDQGSLDDAVACYRKAIVFAPREAGARLRLANLLWQMDRLEEARETLNGILAQGENPMAAVELPLIEGRIASAEGRHQDAYHHFDRAARLFAEYGLPADCNDLLLKANEGMGNARFRQGQRLSALIFYRRALALATDNKQIQLHNLALCLANIGHKREAERVYRQALKYGDDPDCWLGLGDIYAGWEKFRAAAEAYRKALELEPLYSDAHFGLGYVLLMLNEPEAGRAHLDRASQLGHPDAEEMLRDFDLSRFLSR